MPVNAKVASHGQLESQEAILREVDNITLNEASDVSLDLHPRDIEMMTRQGDNLLVTLENGDLVTIESFYADPSELSHLYLQGDEFAGEIFQVGLGEAGASGAVPFTSTATLTTAESALATAAAGASSVGAGAEAATGAGAGAGISTAGLVAGGVAVAAGVGVAAATSGDSASSDADTTAPDAPLLSDTNGMVLSGISEPGATIEVINASGEIVGTATADADGNFVVELDPLQEPGTELSATATDAAGNESAVSDTLLVPEDADVTAPNTPTIASATDDVEAVAGALASGDSTNDATPTLTGSAEAGSTVTITHNGEVIATVTADTNGSWTYTPTTALTEGDQTFSVTATDAAGNESAPSADFTLTVDTTAPDAPILSETDGETANGSTVNGSAEAGGTVEITDADGVVLGTGTVAEDGTFSITLSPKQEAGTELTATVTDAAGNESAVSDTLVVPADTDVTAPNTPTIASATDNVEAVTGTLASGDSTNDATPTLTGSAEAGSTVTLTHNGEEIGTTTADSNGTWSFTPGTEFADGEHVFSVTATDASGNESAPSGEFTLTVDTTAPDAPILSETDGETANGSTVNGSAEAGGTVEITNDDGDLLGTGTVADDGTFSITLSPKQEAGAELTATVTDAAGNESPVSDTLVVPEDVDVTAPNAPTIASATDDVEAVTGTLASGDSTNDATPTLTGSAEIGSTVTVTHNGEVIGTSTADSNGTWSFTPETDFADGDHVFSVTATDAAGNVSAPSGEHTLTVDTTAPDAPTLIESDGTSVSGTAEAGSDIEITNSNGDTVGSGVVEDDGTFSVALDPAQQDGEALTATATDPAGNTSSNSTPTTVDTGADSTAPNTPTITSATDDVPADTGALASGDSTNDATPTLTGSAEIGSTVTVTHNGEVIGTTIADSNGTWSFTPATGFADGEHVFSVTATDAAGNESPTSGEFTLTVDTTAPDAPILSETDGTTVAGTGEAGTTVEITNANDDVVGTAVVDADGNFSVELSPEQEAGSTLTATATDAAGNESATSEALDVPEDADVTAPSAPTITSAIDDVPADTGALASGDSTNDATPTLTGSAEIGSTVTVTHNGEVIGTTIADSNGTWSFTPATGFADGEHVFSVTATDAAGNESVASSEFTLTVDTTAPDAPVLADTDGETANGSTVNGSAEAGGTVEISNGDGDLLGSGTVADDGTFSITLSPKQEAGAELIATVTDAAGNESAVSDTLVVPEDADVTAPNAPTIVSAIDDMEAVTGTLADGDSTKDATPTLTGSAEAGSAVTITHNGEEIATVTADANGTWSFTPATGFADGDHVFSVTATDEAGNESASSADFTLTVDTTAPDAPVLAETDGTTVAGTGEAGTTVEITNAAGDVLASAEVDTDGNFSVALSPEQDAGTELTATVTDTAGNESAISDTLVVPEDADVTAPNAPTIASATDNVEAVTGSLANGDSTNDATPTLTGSAEAGSTITLTHNGEEIGTTTADSSGTWSFTPATDFADGEHVFSVTATDAAGNESAPSADFTLTVDTTAPDAPVLAETDGTTVAGTGEAGTTVEITNAAGDVLASAEVDTDGNFSVALSPEQDAGTELTATVTDAAGNESPASDTLVVPEDADVTAPNAPTIASATDDVAAVTGTLTDGDSTNDATPTLTGSAEAGSTVTITHNGEEIATVTADANGTWSFTPATGFTDGEHVFSVTATDAAGNESAPSADFTLTVDTTAPDAPSLALTTDTNITDDGITSNGEVTVSDLETDATWEYTTDGGTTWVDGTEATFTLAAGSYADGTAQIRQTDVAGNVSDAVNLGAVTVDATIAAPSLALTTDTNVADDGITSNGEVTVSDLEADATWEYTLDGGTTWLAGTGTTFTLAEGSYADGDVQIRQTDVAGNVSTEVSLGAVTVDATIAAPSLALTADTNVADDGITSNGEVTVSGLETDATWEVSLDGGTTWDASTGTTFTLEEGVYADGVVQIRQTDVAGNVSDAVNLGAVTVDTTDPTGSIAFVDGDDGLLNLADISAVDLTGSIEAGLDSSNVVITITDSAEPANEYTVATTDITIDGAGNLSVTGLDLSTATSGLTEGTLTVSMTVTDVAGNTFETDGTTTSDLTAPEVPSLALTADTNVADDGITSNGEVTVSGLETDATWEVSLDGGSTWDASTGTTFTLEEGVYADGVVQIRQTDVAGNVSDAVNLGAVTVDTTDPTGSIAFVDGDDGLLNLADISAVDLTGSIEAGLDSSNVVITITDSADPANEITVATTDITVDGAGNLSVTGLDLSTATSGLTEGALTVSMTVTDVAGNTFETDGTTTSDLTVPDAPSLALTNDTNITDDGITSNGEVTVSGLETDATWEYSLDGGSTWDAGTGTTFTLAEGSYADGVVQVRQTDVAGNVSDAVNLGAVTIDATAPTGSIAFVDGDDGLLNLADISAVDLTGSIEAGLDSSNVVITITDSADPANEITVATTDITVDGAGNLSVTGLDLSTATSGLTEGALTVSMTVTDVAGNTFETDGTTTSDLTVPDAPALALTTDTLDADGITSNGEVTVSGLETGATWEYSLDGGSTWDAGTGTTFTLEEGVYADGVVQIRQTDVAGNVSNEASLGAVTIDATAPTGSIAFVDGDDGLLNLADISAVDLTGSIEAGLDSSNVVITITDSADPANEITVATTDITVDGAGNLSVTGLDLSTATSGLTEGALTVSMTVTDVAGNTFETDGTTTSDLTVPDAPALALTTDTLDADGITSNGEVTVSGLETGATWEYSLDGGSTWDAGTGTTFTLEEGVYADGVVQIRQTDVAGNVSNEASLGAVTIDATAPTGSIAFVDGDDGLLNLADISAVDLTGSIEAGLDSSNVVITITDSADPANEITVATTDITVDGAGNLSVTGLDLSTATSGLTEGALTVSMTVTDVAGNTFETDGTTTSDLTVPDAPSLALTNDTNITDDGITSNGEVTVSGLETDATWEVSLDGGTTWDAGTGTTFTLDEGVYADGVVQIRQTDLAGNVSDAVNLGAVTVDTTDPTGSIAFVDGGDGLLNLADISAVDLTGSIEAGLDSSNVVITITDSADPANEITVATTDITVDGAGNLSVTGLDLSTATSGLTEGALTVSMTVTDVAGNTFETDGTTTSDLTVPDAPALALTTDTLDADGITSNGEVTVSGLETDATWEYSLDGGSTWDASTGTTFTLEEGVYADGVVQIRQTDVAGNVSDAVNLGAVTVDNTAPGAPPSLVIGEALNGVNIDELADGLQAEVALSEDTVAGDTATVTLVDTDDADNVITADVELDETDIDAGTVTVTIPADTLTDGSSYNASAVITDAAGNVSNEVNLGTVTIDATAPTTTITIDSISDDTGLAADDFITNDDDGLTVTATLSTELATGETLLYSTDGTTWVDITDSVTGTAVSYVDTDLTTSATVQLKVQDAAGNDGAIESQDIVIDTTAPSGSVINFTDADGDDLNAAEATDVTFEGTVEAGLTSSNLTIVITDTDNGSVTVPTENITVSAAGEVTVSGVDLTGLAEGLLTVTMTVTDDAGNENVAAVTDTATKLSDDFLDLGNANRLTISEALIASAAGAVASTQTFADTSGEATLSLSSTESLTSNGQALDWVVTDEGRTLTLASDVDNAAATAVMVVSVTEDGSEVVYSAELLGNIDQDEADSTTVDVLVTLTDGDVSTSSTLEIDITDDTPRIAASTVIETLNSGTDYTGNIFDGDESLGYGFGADSSNGQVQSFTLQGLTFTVSDDGTYADVTGTSTEIALEAGDTVSIVDGILAVETLSGESFSLNIDSGDYSYSHQGQFSATEEANTRPQANLTESDGVLGLVGVNVLDIVTLSNDQLYSVYDAEDNVASVTITADGIINTVTDYLDAISEALNALLDTLSLVPGVPTVSELIDILVGNSSWTYSEELAAELGLTVTASPSGESTQSITVTKIDGSEITNIEINELLASVDFTVSSAGILTGLLSLLDLDSLADSILSTTTIYATDSLAASSSDSDASIANVDLLTSDYVVPVDEGTTGNDSVNASQAGSNLYGYAGNDTLNGGSGSNILRGGNGDDTLDGGAGSDLLIGGSGNDSLNGGAGVDVIRWEAGDEGTVAAAATDTVLNFNNGGAGSGDILDLRDMLNGAYYVDSATNNLASYISAEYVSVTGTTVLYINTVGGLTADPAASANQVINIDGLDLTEGGTLTSSEVIDSLISGEQLLVGTEVNESDVSVTVVDGDGDTATGEITFVGEESLDAVTNTAPIVTLQDSELLGLVGLEALDLIDLSNNKVFVADPDNNLREVVINYAALVDVNLLTGVFTDPEFTWDNDLATSLGLSVTSDDNGVLGIIATTAELTITATDGGDIDNLALTQFLATVGFSDGGISDLNLANIDLLDAYSITATDAYDASTTDAISSLAGVELLDSNEPLFSGIDESNTFIGSLLTDDEIDISANLEGSAIFGLSGNDSLIGGLGNDVIRGGEGDDSLVGNAGDDLLIGDSGSNTFDGGAGDDLIVTSSLDFTIEGGADIDTVSFDGTGKGIDLVALSAQAEPSVMTNIEVLDISASSETGTSLKIDADTVLNLTDGDNELYIDGDEGDSVEAAGATSSATTTEFNGTTYDTYQLGEATLYIDQDVTVNTSNG
ncbi:Ig-like domain-containing protein [Cobetia marina]|uniref:Ig-like domain-containing protein n=1 Tax=Cobetia marina TaxID=28258 RepID=UPI00174DB85C